MAAITEIESIADPDFYGTQYIIIFPEDIPMMGQVLGHRQIYDDIYGSGHGTAAVLLPGFAIN